METSTHASEVATHVLVTLPLRGDEPERFRAAMPQAEFVFKDKGATTQVDYQWATVVMGPCTPELVGSAPHLEWLHLGSAGADQYLRPGALPAQTMLTSSVGAYGQAVSEHSFASLLAIMKKLHLYRDDQRTARWVDEGPVTTLRGARVAVLGSGDLGRHFALLCSAMGASCTAVHRHVLGEKASSEFRAAFTDERAMDELVDVLAVSDVVACFLPGSPATRGLADARFFSAMKTGAYFVNAGRGDLVDQDALCDALESGHLAGAALDVCTPEPLPEDSRLWGERNLLLTPHVGGFWHLPVTRDNVVAIALENLRRYAAGEDLLNVQRRPGPLEPAR